MTLRGKVVIVTGSSRGIGRAVALAFADRGCRVLINSHSDITGGQEVADEIVRRGGAGRYVQADAAEPDEVEQMFADAETALGPVDILVNNAGLPLSASLGENTKKHWLHMLNVNLLSTVVCSVRAAAAMQGRGGCIINTSSVRGFAANGRPGVMAYSAAKAAINNFTMTLAKQLAPDVRVNAVAPGYVATSFMAGADQDLRQSWLEHIPLRRFIEPSQLAGSYVYLAESSYLTGMILAADAGFTLGEA
jgi:3-oxoacyl-[acyl-carrier protein] reductase